MVDVMLTWRNLKSQRLNWIIYFDEVRFLRSQITLLVLN
jgi:hypothetical protein